MSLFTPVTNAQYPADDRGKIVVVDSGRWRDAVRWASAVGMAVLTGVVLGFTCNAAGMTLGGPQTAMRGIAPFALGALYGVAGGLSLVDWASEQANRAYVFVGGLAFAAPMIGLAVLRTIELADNPDAAFRSGILTLLEMGGAVALTQVGDVMRSVRIRRDEQFARSRERADQHPKDAI